MELIIDFMLLAASGAAVFYCVILNRKLEALRNTEKGLGSTIASMSQTVDNAHSTVVLAKESSKQSIAELTPLIEEMRLIMPKVTEMIDALGSLGEIARENITSAATAASQDIEERLNNARAVQGEISERICELNILLSGEDAQVQNAVADADHNTDAPQANTSEDEGEIAYIEDIEPLDRRMVASASDEIDTENVDIKKAGAAG